MDSRRVKVFSDCGILMMAEKEISSRYREPLFWTRFHLHVFAPISSLEENKGNCIEYIHYGFDDQRTAELAWDELTKHLEQSPNKNEAVKNFELDINGLGPIEGRIIKYLENGKIWATFPSRIKP